MKSRIVAVAIAGLFVASIAVASPVLSLPRVYAASGQGTQTWCTSALHVGSTFWDSSTNTCDVFASTNIGGTTCILLVCTANPNLVVDSGTTVDIRLIGSILISSGASITVDGGGSIVINSQLGYGINNKGGTLAINSGGSLIIKGELSNTGHVANSGTIEVANNGGNSKGIQNSGTITNTGTIAVANSGSYSQGIAGRAGGSLDNSGTINIQNSGSSLAGILNHGIVTNEPSAAFNVQNTGDYGVDNFGTVINNAGGAISVQCGSTLFNEPSSIFNSYGAFNEPCPTIREPADLGFSSLSLADNVAPTSQCAFTDLTTNQCDVQIEYELTSTVTISIHLAADILMSYNSADLSVPGGTLPVLMRYVPIPDASSVSYNIVGDGSFGISGCFFVLNVQVCTPGFVTVPLTLGGTGSLSFTAPMGSDPPITIPSILDVETTCLTVSFCPLLTLTGQITLAPAPPVSGSPGLGGATALVEATGASGAPSQPLEWDAAGSTQAFSLTLPNNPSGIAITLYPLLHWVQISGGDLGFELGTTTGSADQFFSCSGCISLNFAPLLASSYQSTASQLATSIGKYSQTSATRISQGYLPVPLTSPTLAVLQLTSNQPLNLGSVVFNIQSSGSSSTQAGVPQFPAGIFGALIVVAVLLPGVLVARRKFRRPPT